MPARSSKSAIRFFSVDITFKHVQSNTIKRVLKILFDREGILLKELSYIFCSDDYLLAINKQFLKHDYFTDIISFPLSDPSESLEGEIYISIERVRENAEKFKTDFQEEINRVIFHGALHLCGYDDHSEKEQEIMRKKEDEYLTQLLAVSRGTKK